MKFISILALAASAFALTSQVNAAVSDPQIAAIVVAANQVDINAGQYMLEKTTNPEVKDFAQKMVNDHTAVNKSAVDLVTKLKVTPEENDTSRSLEAGGERTSKTCVPSAAQRSTKPMSLDPKRSS